MLVLTHALGAPDWLGLVLSAATTVLLRGLALWSGYRLPGWDQGSSSH
jgi:hypothetical protein